MRELASAESQAVARLLEAQFPGAPEIREQARRSTVQVQDYGGVLVLAFQPPTGLPPARVEQRIPVEAEAPDADGVIIHLLLHVVGGIVKELEIFREDSQPIQRFPHSGDLRILVN